MFNIKNKSGLKKSILFILFLVLGLGLSFVFSANIQTENLKNNIQIQNKIEVFDNNSSENSSFVIYTKTSNSSKAVPMNDVSTTGTNTNHYSFDVTNNIKDNIPFGAIITIKKENDSSYIIKIGTKGDDDTYGSATLKADNYYYISEIKINNKEIYTTEINANGTKLITINNNLDINYSGEIKFTATAKPILYTIDCFNENSVVVDSKGYTCVDDINASDWYFNASNAQNVDGFDDTGVEPDNYGRIMYAVESSDKNICFNVNIDPIYDDNNHVFYKIISITGYGNFTQDDGQTQPVIIKPTDKVADTEFDFLVCNTGKDSNGVVYWGNKGLVDEIDNYISNYGSEIEVTIDSTFNYFAGNAFNTAEKYFNGRCSLYNLGHTLTHYMVYYTYGINEEKKYYLSYDGDKWGDAGVANSLQMIDISAIDGEYFQDLASAVSGFDRFSMLSKGEIVIEPVWAPVSINIEYTNNEISCVFGDDYTLTTPTDDQSFVCYCQNDKLIASRAVWNYTNLDYSYNETYSIELIKFNLSTIRKVYLNNVLFENNQFNLNSVNGYKFASTSNSITVDEYSYNKSLENNSIPDYNHITYPLVENYVEEIIQARVTNYNYILKGRNGDYIKKVHYNSGSAQNEGDRLSHSSLPLPQLWIYLADDTESVSLPEFIYTNNMAKHIAWHNDSTYFKTSKYDDKYSGEIGSTIAEKWDINSNVSISAIFVYKLRLYYYKDDSYNAFELADEQFYGQNTEINLSNITTDIRGNIVADWILNGKNASSNYTISDGELTRNDKSILFEYNNNISNIYYGISNIRGEGILYTTNKNPIIYALLTHGYTVQIDNSDTYWGNFTINDISDIYNLYGAKSSETLESDKFYETSFNIGSNSSYKFQTNNGSAFLKLEDYETGKAQLNSYIDDNNYYYVYNYGFEILGWKIAVLNGNNVVTYINVDSNNNFILKNDEVSIDVYRLNEKTFGNLAEYINKHVQDGDTIKLIPVWESAEINVCYEDNSIVTVSYGEEYEIALNYNEPGKKFFSCKVAGTTEQYIANSAVWNYLNIQSDKYEYKSNIYNLKVDLVFLDNVYALKLEDVVGSSTYKLADGDYEFNSKTSRYSDSEITYKSLETDNVFKLIDYETSGECLVETYVSKNYSQFINYYARILKGDIKEGDASLSGLTNVEKTEFLNKIQLFNKVYYSNGTLNADGSLTATNPSLWIYLYNNQTLKSSLPIFEKTNTKLIAWNYGSDSYTTTNYTNDYINELQNSKESWAYNNSLSKPLTLTAVYMYALDLYYENKDGGYSYITTDDWYGSKTSIDISKTKPDSDKLPTNAVFAYWMINGELLSDTSDVIKFDYNDTFDKYYNGKFITYYLNITNVRGSKPIEQNSYNPTIIARLHKKYDVTIDNKDTYWQVANNISDLYGAYSTYETGENTDGQFNKTLLAIDYNSSYEFQTNNGLAFLKSKDYITKKTQLNSYIDDENYYYVYNYGFEISGWEYNFDNKGYYSADGLTTLGELIEKYEETYLGQLGYTDIIIRPVWEKAKINISCDGEKISDNNIISFAENYKLKDTIKNQQEGKSIFAYSYNGDNDLIALEAKWNYCNDVIKYEYESGNYVYSIDVTPIYLDNIYKVQLMDFKAFEENKYVLQSDVTDYLFNSTKGVGIENSLNITDVVDITSFKDSGLTLADEYITDNYLLGYRSKYISGISGQDKNKLFDVFRKVYFSSASPDISGDVNNDNTELIINEEPTFYIYLANNQVTGNLPVFKKMYYSHIMWKNNYRKIIDTEEKSYAYKTLEFDDDIHSEEIANHWIHKAADKTELGIWCYDDGYGIEGLILRAHYFRKYYYVNVETLFENIDDRGYVKIEIVDDVDNTATQKDTYIGLAIVEGGSKTMRYYQTDRLELISDIENDYIFTKILLYAGCDITIMVFDQSKDPTNMATGNYDQMIGFKFSVTQYIDSNSTTNIVSPKEDDYYTLFGDKDTINNNGYKCGEELTVKIPFEKIQYSLTFAIDNKNAGNFNVNHGIFSSGNVTEFSLNDVIVGRYYAMTYNALAGYTLQTNAFNLVRNLNEQVLQICDENLNQTYKLSYDGVSNLNGSWLREYFYSKYADCEDYNLNTTNLGQLLIKTDSIEFSYGIKFYNSTNTDNPFFKEYKNVGKFKIDTYTGYGNMTVLEENETINSILTNTDLGFYYFIIDDVKYALLNSRMYFPNNVLATMDNFYTSFDFLLKDRPNNIHKLSTISIARMAVNYQSGKIIPNENRTLSIMLEVRELLSITMQIKRPTTADTDNTTRSTTISNAKNNSVTLSITSSVVTLGDYSDVYDNKATVYTYKDLPNKISSKYDSKRYDDVKYYIDNNATPLGLNNFTISKDIYLTIEYIPKTLNVRFVYKVDDGAETAYNNSLEAYIREDIKPSILSGYYIHNILEYGVDVINTDYIIRVEINGVNVGTSDNINTYVDIDYEVGNADYLYGEIKVLVNIVQKANQKVRINYLLDDVSKRDIDDKYGLFSVYIDNDLQNFEGSIEVESVELVVFDNRSIYVETKINDGYEYVGIKSGLFSTKYVEPFGNKILLIENFNINVHPVDYFIVVRKIEISASITTENVKTTEFRKSVNINGELTLNNLYVGSTITLNYQDCDLERLNYFYYLNTDNEQVKVEGTALKITSEIFRAVGGNNIAFGVATINRYRLTLDLTGGEFLSEDVAIYLLTGDPADYEIGDKYTLGTYLDEGTQLTFSVIPNDMDLSDEHNPIFKYDIKTNIDENVYGIIEMQDFVIELHSDNVLKIVISPKTYNVNVIEKVYYTLTELENGAPADPSTNVNNMYVNGVPLVNSSTLYKNLTILEFVANKADDRTISTITISNNDRDEVIVIRFNGVNYVATIGENEIELEDYGYSLANSTETIRLTYITMNDITIELHFKDYKTISTA